MPLHPSICQLSRALKGQLLHFPIGVSKGSKSPGQSWTESEPEQHSLEFESNGLSTSLDYFILCCLRKCLAHQGMSMSASRYRNIFIFLFLIQWCARACLNTLFSFFALSTFLLSTYYAHQTLIYVPPPQQNKNNQQKSLPLQSSCSSHYREMKYLREKMTKL